MAIRIALAGNPNSGKTTMFNELTGSSQYVGNWPGVTVEKKRGKAQGTQGYTNRRSSGDLFPVAVHAGGGCRTKLYHQRSAGGDHQYRRQHQY